MFRAIQLEDQEGLPKCRHCTNPMSDPITLVLFEKIQQYLDASAHIQELPIEIFDLFKQYQDELSYICVTHTLSNEPETKLLEEEVVIGTILAKCSQKRWRSNRIYRMRHHVGTLINDIKQTLKDLVGFDDKVESPLGRVRLLELGWKAWNFSVYKREEFGANSFGLIALSVIFDCLDRLEKVSVLA
jgi:RNA-dependent RNA polymerase